MAYKSEMEKPVLEWISGVLGEGQLFAGVSGEDSVHAAFKSGIVLCRLINKIKPGCIKKFHNKTRLMGFMEMENIGFVNEAMREYGVQPDYLFVTVDLYEKKNMTQVLIGLRALGTLATKNGIKPAITI